MKKGLCLLLLFSAACSGGEDKTLQNIAYLSHKDLIKTKYVEANNMEDYMQYNEHYIDRIGYRFIADSIFCVPQNKKWRLPNKDNIISNLIPLEATFATVVTFQDNQAVESKTMITINNNYDMNYSGLVTCRLVTYFE